MAAADFLGAAFFDGADRVAGFFADFFAAGFFAAGFFGAAFFAAGSGAGICIPGMCWCWAATGAAGMTSASALAATNNLDFTTFLRGGGSATSAPPPFVAAI